MMIDTSKIVRIVLFTIFLATNIFSSLHAVEEESLNLKTTADYIIVGGGTAGAALAARLSKEFTVIVLEGGTKEDNNPLISDPLASGSLVRDYTNEFFWALGHTEVLPSSSNPPPPPLQNGRRWSGVAGELLGGGSAVNGMQYVRGDREFFSGWQNRAGGDPAWGTDNATAVYKRLETFNGVPGQFNPFIHGTHGPVDIRQAVRNLNAATLFQNAVSSLGYAPIIGDYNDPDAAIGAYLYWQLFQQPNKTRESSSTAYLDEILREISCNEYLSKNKKLLVVTQAKVQRILIDDSAEKPEAYGVLAVVNGVEQKYEARHEVILSAGFQSTLLLQLSGIGDEEKLCELGIPVVYDNNNVGQHAKNHPGFQLTGIGNVPFASNPDPQALYDGGAFLSNPATPGSRDFQVIGVATPPGAFTLASLILDPTSEGFVTLYSSDPNRMPHFNFNTYNTQTDINSAVTLYGLMYKILEQMGLQPLGPLPTDTDGVIDYAIKGFVGPFQNYHYQSTNRMSTSPQSGVVDNDGRVFGVRNLRVADASIIPVNALGNTAALAFLIGNIIADKILDN